MGWQWQSIRTVSALTLALWSGGGMFWWMGRTWAQGPSTPSVTQATLCADQRDQFLYLTVRDAAYRSYVYLNQEHYDLAAQVLRHTASLTDSIADPFARTDLVSLLVGTTGSDPSALGQLVRHSLALQQPELALGVLAAIAPAVQGLDGEYGVVNSQRAMLVQLAEYYQQLGQPDAARPLLAQARTLLDRLPGDGWGFRAAPIAQGYAAMGDYATAIALLDTARQHTQAMRGGNLEYQSDILATLAIAYAQAQALDTALAVLDTISVADIQARALAQLLTDHAASASPSQRAALERQVTRLATAPVPRTRAAALATAYAALGQWPQAQHWLRAITDPEARLTALIPLALLARDTATAQPLITTFLDVAQNSLSFTMADGLVYGAAQHWLAQGREDLVTLMIEQLPPRTTLHDEVVQRLIRAASAAGRFDLARGAITRLEPGWANQVHSQAFLTLLRGYLQQGQITAALAVLPNIADTPYLPQGAAAHIAVAQFYRRQGQSTAALEYLTLARQALATLEETTSAQVPLLGFMVLELEALGQSAASRAVLAEAVTLASQDMQGIDLLARQLLQGGHPDLALDLVPLLPNAIAQDLILGLIVNDLLPLGIEAPALRAMEQVQDPQARVVLLTTLADFARAQGATSQALGYLDQALGEAIALPGPDRIPYNDPSLPPRDPRDRGSLLGAIALRYAGLGHRSAAQRITSVLRDSGDRATLTQQLTCYGG